MNTALYRVLHNVETGYILLKLENNKTEAISNLKHIKSDNLTDWYKAATNNIETYFKYKNICHDNRRLLINGRNDSSQAYCQYVR